jgi:hypothetical protein
MEDPRQILASSTGSPLPSRWLPFKRGSVSVEKHPTEGASETTETERKATSSQWWIPIPFTIRMPLVGEPLVMKPLTKTILVRKQGKTAYPRQQNYNDAAALRCEVKEGPVQAQNFFQEIPDYPGLASSMDGTDTFAAYGRFDYLHSRLLLDKQREIIELEKELNKLDEIDAMSSTVDQRDGRSLRNRKELMDLDVNSGVRREILSKLHNLLEEYDRAILRFKEYNSWKEKETEACHKERAWIQDGARMASGVTCMAAGSALGVFINEGSSEKNLLIT